MNINKTLVKEVKAHNKLLHHDLQWHGFQSQIEVVAVNYALSFANDKNDLDEIVLMAKDYENSAGLV